MRSWERSGRTAERRELDEKVKERLLTVLRQLEQYAANFDEQKISGGIERHTLQFAKDSLLKAHWKIRGGNGVAARVDLCTAGDALVRLKALSGDDLNRLLQEGGVLPEDTIHGTNRPRGPIV